MGIALAATAHPSRQNPINPAEVEPSLQVEVQVSSRRGRSKDPRAAGVRIEVCEYPLGPEVRVLAAYQTNDQGKVTIHVPAGGYHEFPGGGASVMIRINQEGFQTRYVQSLFRRGGEEAGEYQTGFRLIPGRTVLGQVYGPMGRPDKFRVEYRAEGPDVVVAPIMQTVGCSSILGDPHLQILGPSSFAYHYTEPGTTDFQVSVEGLGTAAIHGVELTLDSPPENLSLHIAGPGIIRGKVVGSDGKPRRSVPVLCTPASGEEAHTRPGWKCDNWSVEIPGLLLSQIKTDTQGRFEFTGLRMGSYRLSLDNIHTRQLSLRPDSFRNLHDSDGHEITLVVVQGRVRLKLLDMEGNPVEGVDGSITSSRSISPAPVVTVYKSASTPWGHELHPSGRFYFNARTGAAYATVQAGQTYWVQIRGGGFEKARIPVVVDENGTSKLITIQATSQPAANPSKTGTIQVTVVDRWGNPLEPWGDYHLDVETTQGDRACTLCIPGDWFRSEDKPQMYELPVGHYKLVVTGAVGKHSSSAVYLPIARGRTERLIQVEKGSHKVYEITLEDAGKLLVLLQGKTTHEDKLVAKFDHFSGPHSTWGPGLDSIRANAYPWEPESVAKLTLYHKDRPPIRLMHVVRGTSRMNSRCDRWPLNQMIRSDYVPSGDYILVTELAAGRRVQKKVTVTAGKLQGVRVVIP